MSKKAIDLLRIVWTAHGNDAWTAINHSMRVALNLAIGARLEWDKKAIIEVEQTMRSHYWIGEDGWEWAYALAVAVENHSFIEAYEVHTGRKPFFANNVTTRDGDGYINRNSGCTRKRERLALGSICGGGKVTSIGADHVTVCTYERNDRTPKKREKLTREMCLERWPAKKSERQPVLTSN